MPVNDGGLPALGRPGARAGAPRYPVGLTATATVDGRAVPLRVVTLGADGMSVEATAEAPAERPCRLAIGMPGHDGPLELPAVVSGRDGARHELRFVDGKETVRAFFRAAVLRAYPTSIQAARLRVAERAAPPESERRAEGLLSVVVPVFNEAAVVGHFHAALVAALAELGVAHEVIYVDDGSTDETAAALARLAGPAVRVLSLSRNFGHQAAVLAGLEASSGVAVVTMDGDLQHPPSLLGALVAEWRSGVDIVNTIRNPDPRLGFFKKATSRLFYALFSLLSTLDLPAGAADFRLMDRYVVDVLLSFRERHFFLRGLAHWVGFRSTYLRYDPAPRPGGASKFTLLKMLRLASDAFFSFSAFPLRLVLHLGLFSLFVTFLVVLYVAYAQVTRHFVPGWSSLLLILSFFSGLQMLGLGVVAEYVGRIFTEAKMRPRYLTRAAVEHDDPVFQALSELTARG